MGDQSLLQQMHSDVLIGSPLAKDSYDYASLLNLHISPKPSSARGNESHNKMCLESTNGGIRSHQDSTVSDAVAFLTDDKSDSSANTNFSAFSPREIMLLQLTLIEMMLTKVQSKETEYCIRQKYCDIIRILLKETQADSKLIWLLGSSDKLLCHMASKSMASLVYFQLKEENSLNVTWLAFCLKTLSEFPRSVQAAECLWTLTAIIRDVLKDEDMRKADIMKKLFTPLDAVLEGFHDSILFHHFDSHRDASAHSKTSNDLIAFIDLLEVLVACRFQLALHFRCQRILFLKTTYILGLASSSVHYLIKKKSIMLVKKCILCKAGEDFTKGLLLTPSLQDPYLDMDMVTLAAALLEAVDLGWMNRITVSEKACYFGGSETQPKGGVCTGPDQVIIRALSLILLKALETKIQNSAEEAEVKANLRRFMSILLTFLKNHLKSSPHSYPTEHPCEWLSVVFVEQDDDMLEAAKALLTIYLKLNRLWHAAAGDLRLEETWDDLTHESGCNPHCIFLYLLKNISFDSTVLLDFLISSETCFLEYFVRYLKLLREGWHHFVNICNCFDAVTKGGVCDSFATSPHQGERYCQTVLRWQTACYDPEQQTPAAVVSSHESFAPTRQHCDDQVAKSDLSNTVSLGCLQSLVNYDSSEDSDSESVGKESLANVKQMPINKQGSTKIREAVSRVIDDEPNTFESKMLPLGQKGSNTSSFLACRLTSNNPPPIEGMLHKAMKCLEELQKAISRLQRKNLFPYNPAALLKLLLHIERICKSMNPL
ncbi:protein Lines homolog 1 [Alligator mississippiensis]|uniref:protein Lines homolog 1 n=1 Tax=Alligator mississippiensis TaxID=8496 RepID=UPI000711FA53|nr:protein Lines homolog 1 [Alligator mississippiensis]XP_014461597.1 protein Lines homolog 1 [Alligator mississippiensis]XP_019333294.1 protein Lines homolog 1 [Alligator mississippiensis]XP_059570544.1 protein Lines homolog 1 [Alligator mississippiensis]